MPKQLRSYHFDCGNSATGPVGFCARVKAYSKKEALEILQSAMPQEYETGIAENDDNGDKESRIEYFNFYLNSASVKVRHIDDFEDAEEDEDADPVCDACGEPYAEGGDGYDGKCPSCADKAERRRVK